MKTKGSQGVSERFDDLIREVKIYADRVGDVVSRVHTDMGTEYKGAF